MPAVLVPRKTNPARPPLRGFEMFERARRANKTAKVVKMGPRLSFSSIIHCSLSIFLVFSKCPKVGALAQCRWRRADSSLHMIYAAHVENCPAGGASGGVLQQLLGIRLALLSITKTRRDCGDGGRPVSRVRKP